MKKETKKQPLKEEELLQGQFICPVENCRSRKIQAIYIKNLGLEVTITMLCLSCGYLYPFFVSGNIIGTEQEKITPNKSPPNYTT